MSRKVLIPLLVAVVAAAVTVGVLTAHAQGSTTLPSVTPAQLLADMATKAHETTSISGEVTWKNNLVGDMSALNLGGANTATGIASLLQGGSGRIWLQDGKARLESQGQAADLAVVAADGTMWTYSSATDTATEYVLPKGSGSTTSPSPEPTPSIVDPTAQIEQALQKLAPTATMAVTGQEDVAGQPAYILTLTPTATNTTLGSVKVAIDGNTFVPLRIEVYPKGSSTAALSGGFTSVSYSKIGDNLFQFTPPPGAKVEHKTVDLPASLGQSLGGTQETTTPEKKPLTLEQAKAQAGFDLALPTQTELPFSGAAVIPAKAGAQGHGPVVLLHYGKGFGAVTLIETPTTADQASALEQQVAPLVKAQLVRPTTVGGSPGLEFSTSLFNALFWQQGKLTLAAAGMVPQAELSAFAASVR
jgi:outer membrane lipoprotein-sorting protein